MMSPATCFGTALRPMEHDSLAAWRSEAGIIATSESQLTDPPPPSVRGPGSSTPIESSRRKSVAWPSNHPRNTHASPHMQRAPTANTPVTADEADRRARLVRLTRSASCGTNRCGARRRDLRHGRLRDRLHGRAHALA
jgi:hypothetical protein